MINTSSGSIKKRRHQKILKLAKGFKGSQSKLFKIANQRVMRSLKYMYFDRKKKKAEYKHVWLNRINATCQKQGYKYNELKKKLKKKNILINNKTLANLFLLDNRIENKLFSI